MPTSVSAISPIYFPKLSTFFNSGLTFEEVESDCETTLSDWIQKWLHTDTIKFQTVHLLSISTTEVYLMNQDGIETLLTPTVSSVGSTIENYSIALTTYKNQKIQIIIKENFSGVRVEEDRTPWMDIVEAGSTRAKNLLKFSYWAPGGTTEKTQEVYYGTGSVPDITHDIRILGVVYEDVPEVESDQFIDTKGIIQNTGITLQTSFEIRFPYVPSWLYRKIGYIATSPILELEGRRMAFNGPPRKGNKISGNKWLYECQLPIRIQNTSNYSY